MGKNTNLTMRDHLALEEALCCALEKIFSKASMRSTSPWNLFPSDGSRTHSIISFAKASPATEPESRNSNLASRLTPPPSSMSPYSTIEMSVVPPPISTVMIRIRASAPLPRPKSAIQFSPSFPSLKISEYTNGNWLATASSKSIRNVGRSPPSVTNRLSSRCDNVKTSNAFCHFER